MENINKIYNLNYIKKILSSQDIYLSKKLGQNFLHNPNICKKMSEMVDLKNSTVIEIGSGLGILTRYLSKNSRQVISIEIDHRLISILKYNLKDLDNVEIINADFLKMNLDDLFRHINPKLPVKICANLPYCVTSQILIKILEYPIKFDSITVMVQKETAYRICAKPATRNSNFLSLMVHYFYYPKMLFHVSKNNFFPIPDVNSTVIHLNILKEIPVFVNNKTDFFRLIKYSFAHRRKTLINSLCKSTKANRANLMQILKKLNMPINCRAEQLSLNQFAEIFKYINKHTF